MTIVRIGNRFCGPPGSGNGGYFAGLLARELGGSNVVVTLKRPAPLDVELQAERDGDRATLFHGEAVLAVTQCDGLTIEVPRTPTPKEAEVAQERFNKADHIYPGCFVCRPDREPGDGLRIFPGPIAVGRVAANWTPAFEFADQDGTVRPEFVWAALDCPGYFAMQTSAGLALLGRMGVLIRKRIAAGQKLLVQGWAIGSDGRKHHAGTAVHDSAGRLLAAAMQTWVTLR